MSLRSVISGMVAVLVSGTGFVYAQGRNAPPPTVVTDRVKMVSESAPRRYVGVVEPIRHVDIMPRITGNLLKLHFKEGEMVKKGELLYELEDTAYRAAVDGLEAQKELMEAALRYADAEFKRSSSLLKSRAVAVSAHDKALLDIDSAKANIKQISASLTDARNTLSYTRIHAPISGRIGKSAFTEGNLITPQGGKLTDIEMIAPIYVRFSLSERIFRRDFGGMDGIRKKAWIRIQLADGAVYPEKARITLIDNKVNSSTNTITLWGTFENRDGQLIPGSFVTVLVSAAEEKSYPAVLPSALIMSDSGCKVYVLDTDNKVHAKTVTPGTLSGGLQIIRNGLDGTERVLVDGTHKVQPGMTVTPIPADQVR